MSDLISTPSQTRSAVSNDAFESLIDLLASDGIDEKPSNFPDNQNRPQVNTSLRDASGKLDFDKIRLMYTSHNVQKPLWEGKKRVQTIRALTLSNDDGDSDDEHHSHRSTSSTAPSRSNSMSPKPADHATAGHRRSSTFGSQPWAAIHGNVTQARVEDVQPTVSDPPLSFDELNAALAGAQEEVKSLRRQYDELQALVSKRLVSDRRDPVKHFPSTANTDKDRPDKDNRTPETRDTGSQAQPIAAVSPSLLPSDLPTEISRLSEDEAKQALCALARSLNISPSTICSIASSTRAPSTPTSPQQSLSPLNSTRQHDVASIARAVNFLGSVDELVWRRTSAPSGPRTLLPVFSEENVVSLLARLELWERAVRRSSRY